MHFILHLGLGDISCKTEFKFWFVFIYYDRRYHFISLPRILLGLFLNTLTWIIWNFGKSDVLLDHVKLCKRELRHSLYLWGAAKPCKKGIWVQLFLWQKFFMTNDSKYPADIYLFKVNSGNTRTVWGVCSKLTIKTSERRQWLYLLASLLLT